MSSGSESELQLENEHFRVVRWTIHPGGEIPMHRHEYEYVVVPLVTAEVFVENADGTTLTNQMQEGVGYSRFPGAEHRLENRFSDEPIVFVEIERL